MARQRKTTRILTEARDLLARPKGWTKGMLTRNHYSGSWKIGKIDCTAYCSMGAVAMATEGSGYGIPHNASLKLLQQAILEQTDGKTRSVVSFNDASRTTKKAVLAAFDRAIELSRQ